jgi:hypothetical protein
VLRLGTAAAMCYLRGGKNKTRTIMLRTIMKGAVVALLLALCGGNAGATETSPCKGLSEVACLAEKGCSWVKPGKTTAGKERAGYCRKKPVKKSAAPAKSGTATSTEKTDKK